MGQRTEQKSVTCRYPNESTLNIVIISPLSDMTISRRRHLAVSVDFVCRGAGLERRGAPIATLVLLIGNFLFPAFAQSRKPEAFRTVVRVVDGDTILLDGNERVRLIGVDTPESVDPRRPVERFGKEASAFTRKMVEGQQVRLEYDQTRKDRYGRTLGYVFLKDGRLLNSEIIKQGYGFAYTKYPFRFMEEFRRLEREAREAKRGLWKEE